MPLPSHQTPSRLPISCCIPIVVPLSQIQNDSANYGFYVPTDRTDTGIADHSYWTPAPATHC